MTAHTARGAAVPAADPPRPEAAPETVDELLDLSAEQLHGLYLGASTPRLEDVSGDLRGRMLAIDLLPPALDRLPRAWARTRLFPWRGKSFRPHDGTRGEGINRVISDRLRLFRFETSVAPSRAGDFDAVQLDYDLPENPFFIRAIEDEIRELRPGLWLGQAWLRTGATRRLVLYFGLERRG